jgi:hypothetical protein
MFAIFHQVNEKGKRHFVSLCKEPALSEANGDIERNFELGNPP